MRLRNGGDALPSSFLMTEPQTSADVLHLPIQQMSKPRYISQDDPAPASLDKAQPFQGFQLPGDRFPARAYAGGQISVWRGRTNQCSVFIATVRPCETQEFSIQTRPDIQSTEFIYAICQSPDLTCQIEEQLNAQIGM